MLARHVAVSVYGILDYAKQTKRQIRVVFREQIKKIKEFVAKQVELKIPIMTFDLVSAKAASNEQYFSRLMDGLVEFFRELKDLPIIDKEKIKISVLGKWYYLPGRVIDSIKDIIEYTKDYDGFFLNFCINYDGQEEIVDACRIIARKIKAGKLDPDAIDKEVIKDNIYSSYFLPPDLIIATGKKKSLKSFLLWDSPYAQIHFANKGWPEFTIDEFEKIVKKYQS